MKLQFQLSGENFLTFQLYMASQTPSVMKRRAKGKYFMLFIYIALGIWIWSRYGTLSGALFFLVCLPLYFLYVWMDRRQFVQHFKKYIQNHLQDQLKNPVTLEFQADHILMTYNQVESQIPLADIKVIHEIPSLVVLILKGGQSILIPRSASTADRLEPDYFNHIATTFSITYIVNKDWKWR